MRKGARSREASNGCMPAGASYARALAAVLGLTARKRKTIGLAGRCLLWKENFKRGSCADRKRSKSETIRLEALQRGRRHFSLAKPFSASEHDFNGAADLFRYNLFHAFCFSNLIINNEKKRRKGRSAYESGARARSIFAREARAFYRQKGETAGKFIRMRIYCEKNLALF